MRFIGLLGIVVLLGLAFIFSKNRSAVKPRVIIWGLGLQLLFATIILAESVLSWIGMYIFSFLVLIYIFENYIISGKNRSGPLGYSALLMIVSAFIITFSYFFDKLHISSVLVFMLVVLMIIFYFFKKSNYNKYVFAGIMFLWLGIIIHREIYGKDIFNSIAYYFNLLLQMTDKGSTFLFGRLADPAYYDQFGSLFAFTVLPIIIFFSAIISILYYLGIMQAVVKIMAKFMRWTMGTSGAETLSCSANIFVGQTEAPLLIRPFLDDMTESELHAVMVGGFATIAGSVLAGYIRMGINPGHLIAASVMSAPAALAMAKILIPETQKSRTAGDVQIPDIKRADNLLDAATQGVTDGLKLALNVGAMLLAFIALIALFDSVFGYFDRLIDGRLLGGAFNEIRGEYKGIFPGSLKTLFGTIFAPLAFVMGVPWKEALDVGNLMGIKIAVNEFVGYAELAKHINLNNLSPRSIVIATYALCGFANFASIGIQIGGISALAPGRRSDLSRVALRAMFGGALASWTTASIAGLLI